MYLCLESCKPNLNPQQKCQIIPWMLMCYTCVYLKLFPIIRTLEIVLREYEDQSHGDKDDSKLRFKYER